MENRVVKAGRRWAIILVDQKRSQTLAAARSGGWYWVAGTSPSSIRLASEYARQYGVTYSRRRDAEAEVEARAEIEAYR